MKWRAARQSGAPRSAGCERGRLERVVALAVCAVALATATRAGEAATPATGGSRPSSTAATGSSLDHRFKVLSKALDLDARQRSELWKILDNQRQAVRKIWSDPALIPAERVPALRALQDRTADEIRTMLTDEQKKRYNPPRPQGAHPAPANVEAWMEAARGQSSASSH